MPPASHPDPRAAAIVAVGSELTAGAHVDTNSAWLSQRLAERGAEVRWHLTVGDDLDELVEALRFCAERCGTVVVGGGLGPTVDDLTREAVARAAGVELEHREELAEEIRRRFAAVGYRMPEANLRQALVPAGAVAYDPVGTAPAFRCELGGAVLYALPGVPWELQQLAERDVLPDVADRLGAGAVVTRLVRVAGMGESSVAEAVDPVLADLVASGTVALGYLATNGEIQVELTGRGADVAAARAATEPAVAAVRAALGAKVVGVDDETLEQVVLRLLEARGQTVAFAESATAGAASARLARVPGAATALRGGLVVYATECKTLLAGVDPDLVAAEAPVSLPVTAALAAAVRERAAADWGVGITGVAGPDPQDGVEVGTCVWAVHGPDGLVEVKQRHVPGDRATVQARLVVSALDALRRALLAT
ncbi:MAG: CinA family nicotinamide mononucleotide deamidase-related protein [Actinomycetes bacterium]